MLGVAYLLLNDDSDPLERKHVVLLTCIAVVLVAAVSTISNAINAVVSNIKAALNSEA